MEVNVVFLLSVPHHISFSFDKLEKLRPGTP